MQVEILLTLCRPELEWTCNDGECISITQRCNSVRDCADASDEVNCNAVILHNYDRSLLPPPTQNIPFTLTIGFNITVSKISVSSFTISLDIVETFQWQDNRVVYRFCRAKERKVLDIKELWTPSLLITEASSSPAIVNEGLGTVYVTKTANATKTPDHTLLQGQNNTVDMLLYYIRNINQVINFDIYIYTFL